MSQGNELPIQIGLDVAMLALSLVDGPIQIAEEEQVLSMLRFRSKQYQLPGDLLEQLAKLRDFAAELDESNLALLLVDWGERHGIHGATLLGGLVKQAMCDKPICLAERRFMAAVAWWVNLQGDDLLAWYQESRQAMDSIIARGVSSDILVEPDTPE